MIELRGWTFLPTPMWPDAPTDAACRVVAPSSLTELERAQLSAVLCAGAEPGTPPLVLEDWLAPGFGDRRPDLDWVASFAECPAEWWDVVDEGRPVARLFLYGADCARALAAGTTDQVAQAQQFGSAWEGFAGPFLDPAFRERFAAAHGRAVAAHPTSALRGYYPL